MAVVVLVVVHLGGASGIGLGGAGAASVSSQIAAASPGQGRAQPIALGQETAAGPLRLHVVEVLAGPGAVERVIAASPVNLPPREGLTYVLVNLGVRNDGEQPFAIDGGDFALTGDSGVVYRFLGAQPPAPALAGAIEPGATLAGWVVFAAPVDERNLLLLFDSLSLPGVWADRVLAVEAGAAIPDTPAPAAERNEVGVDPANPARFNDPIVTADWRIELLEVAQGAAVFDLVDYRTGALGVEDSVDDQPWLALRLRVTNVAAGGDPSFLPPNAFALVDAAGTPILDQATLTPPRPDASGDYYPGASREGWVAFELPSYDPYLIRFLPYAATTADPDPRYLAYG